jgi:hypothetical protein
MTIDGTPRFEFFTYLNRIFDIQISNLKKSLELASANFLVAVGCMNTIEFLGGLQNGELASPGVGNEKRRFKTGVLLIGNPNGVYLLGFPDKPASLKTMWLLRCSLTHEYIPKLDDINTIIIFKDEKCVPTTAAKIVQHNGVDSVSSPVLAVNLTTLIGAIEKGRTDLINQLMADKIKLRAVKDLLHNLPRLI